MKPITNPPVIKLNEATERGKNSTKSEPLPMIDITEPGDNDVLSGRGVTTNKHAGNVNFRNLVALNKELYVSSTKKQKMAISRSIVEAVRSMNPPGRFLEKDVATSLWSDIGDRKAVEKTSQALRDGAATFRKQLSQDMGDPDFLNAVFDGNAAPTTKSSPMRSDSSASGNSSNGDSKRPFKTRTMKSKLAKKDQKRDKFVVPVSPASTGSQKAVKKVPSEEVPKKAELDQLHFPTEQVTVEKKVVVLEKNFRPPSNDTGSTRTGPVPKVRPLNSGRSGKHHFEPIVRSHPASYWEKEDIGSGPLVPWDLGHSRNSSCSSGAIQPFFPMSPNVCSARPPVHQPISSCFQRPKNNGLRHQVSPMHHSWSPRDFHESATHFRHSFGEPTCFSDGDIDIPMLDRTFERNFHHSFPESVRGYCAEDVFDGRMDNVVGQEEMLVAVSGDGTEKIRSRSTTATSSDLRYSPSICDFNEKSELLGEVIMKDCDPIESRVLSPLPFLEDDTDNVLLENLPDYLNMPVATYY